MAFLSSLVIVYLVLVGWNAGELPCDDGSFFCFFVFFVLKKKTQLSFLALKDFYNSTNGPSWKPGSNNNWVIFFVSLIFFFLLLFSF